MRTSDVGIDHAVREFHRFTWDLCGKGYGPTFLTRSFPVSAIYRFPALSTAMPTLFNVALVANPPSPVKPKLSGFLYCPAAALTI